MHFVYLATLLLTVVKPLVMTVLRALSIGVVTYVGINLVIEQGKDYLMANVGNAAPAVQAVLGLAKIDVAINIYFAAITTRLVLNGINKLADRRSKLGHNTTFTA